VVPLDEGLAASALTGSPVGVVILCGDVVRYWNPAAQRVLGLPDAGAPIPLTTLPERVRLLLEEPTSDTLDEARPLLGRTELPDGSVMVCVPPALEERPDLNRLLQAEQQVVVGQLSAAVAKEIGGPLQGIQAAADALLAASDGQENGVRSAARQILEQSHRISRLARQLVDLAAPGTPRMAAVPVSDVVRDAVDLVGGALGRAGVILEISPAGSALPPAHADAAQLRQVLLNLLLNACTALETVEGARRILVREEARNGDVLIRVEDSGPGVPDEARVEIFLPFTSMYGGTGLGLPMARQLLTEMGGTLTLGDSSLGGAAFVVTLRKAADG
jgi:C4-dicarboxylate-specific signal transduction histidine kinase